MGAPSAVLAVLVLGGPLLANAAHEVGGPLWEPPAAQGASRAADEADTSADEAATEAGRAALSNASAAKRAAQALEDEERGRAMLAVVAQYDAIAEGDVYAVPERTEAAFRAGEILRTLKRVDEADTRFTRAVALGEAVEDARGFAARALLERAHILRRADDVEAALALYAEVGRRFADQRRSAAHALTWTGKLLLRNGKLEQGAETLQGFADAFPEYATEAVRNADLVAVSWWEAGDEPAARATVAWIEGRMEPLLGEGGRQAELVRQALERMRVTSLLAGD
jgi:tetratricopeptide (TPR) repeat protein